MPKQGFLVLFCLKFTELLGSVNLCLSPDWKIFSHYFFKRFSAPFSLLAFWDSNQKYVRILVMAYRLWTLYFFSSIIFSLFFTLDNFKFFGSLLCYPHSATKLVSSKLLFKFLPFLVLELKFGNFYGFYFSAETSYLFIN